MSTGFYYFLSLNPGFIHLLASPCRVRALYCMLTRIFYTLFLQLEKGPYLYGEGKVRTYIRP